MQYQRKLKKVKSLLRGYDAADLAGALFKYMNESATDDVERLRRHPWLIMLILKWNFLENRVNPQFSKTLSNKDFMRILNTAFELGDLVKMPTEVSHYRNMMRNIAFQQFIYQKNLSYTILATNHILFSELPDNHRLKSKFKSMTDVDVKCFNKCCLVICSAFLSCNNTLSINNFEVLFDKLGRDNLQKTLDLLSVDIFQAKNKIEEHDSSNGTYSEWYEQTPFLKFPLIKCKDRYACVNIYVLLRAIEQYVYEFLKSADSEYFMNSFGKIFESYLKHGLDYSECQYLEENTLKKGLPKGVGVVDFVVSEQESSIFIDAKGVELPYLGKVSDIPKVILGKVKSSALKAIGQANSLNNFIYNHELPSISHKENNYLLVVTYKELYLGNGQVFYDSIAREAIDGIYNGISDNARIPLENIYFMSVDSFDYLCSVIKKSDLTFAKIIEHAKTADQETSRMKFDFQQHLVSLDTAILRPDYLSGAIRELTDVRP